jgi:signal peptidase I
MTRRYRRSDLRIYLEALLIAVIFATFARTFVVQAFKIPSGSMEPNLLVGDHILVNKFVYGPVTGPFEDVVLPRRDVGRGDVVVFRFPEDPSRDFIKRCVGLPGDEIRIVDKVLHVNGRPVDDAGYAAHTDETVYPDSRFLIPHYRRRDNFGPEIVSAGHYFCLGDNRDHSNDSRFWGPVPARYVKGRALLVYWSFDASGDSAGWSGVQDRIERLSTVMLGFFDRTRWERSFRIVR